jgi:bifunctional oligoribonuclease and PAP phosphatase NrnA
MTNNIQRNIIDLLKRHNKILVLPSSPPDGDAIGSAIALYIALRKLDKEVTVVCHDPIPEVLDFLPSTKIIGGKISSTNDFIISIHTRKSQIDQIKSSIEEDKVNIIITPKDGHISESDIIFNKGKIAYDLIITVDCAELSQLRDIYENNIEIFQEIPVINIDHHVSNTHFGRINYVDIMASATTELLLPLLETLGKEEGTQLIDEDIATLLLTGIITDTGSFQNANTTPRSFEKASELIAYGARQQEIIQYIYKTKQLSQLKLWGRVLSKIQTDDKYRIVWSVVSQQDFRDTGSIEDETGDIIDELMTNAPGAEIIILMKEKKDGSISCSVRTTSAAVDGSRLAEEFGGGGHTQAAGFRLDANTDLREAEFKVIEAAKNFQAQRLNIVEDQAAEPAKEKVKEEILIKTEKPKTTAKSSKKATKSKSSVNGDFKVKTADSEKAGESKVLYKFEE